MFLAGKGELVFSQSGGDGGNAYAITSAPHLHVDWLVEYKDCNRHAAERHRPK